jgi:hypothetical protein
MLKCQLIDLGELNLKKDAMAVTDKILPALIESLPF